MFNLLMQWKPWEGGIGSVPLARLFEYTDGDLANRFGTAGSPNLAELTSHPCLFMSEGVDDQSAHVGTVYQRWLGKFGQKSFWDKWKDLLID